MYHNKRSLLTMEVDTGMKIQKHRKKNKVTLDKFTVKLSGQHAPSSGRTQNCNKQNTNTTHKLSKIEVARDIKKIRRHDKFRNGLNIWTNPSAKRDRTRCPEE